MVGYFIEQAIEFILKKVKFLDSILGKALLIFFLVTGGLYYLFLNKELVYETDLTGPQAILLQEKDQKFGTQDKVYADRIDLPLILYYSDSPFEVVDMAPMRNKLENANPQDKQFFITKESRLRKLQETFPDMQLVDQQKEWVLAFSSKDYYYDAEKVKIFPKVTAD
jgi:hypothetical protein